MSENNERETFENENQESEQFILENFLLNPLSSAEFIKPEFADRGETIFNQPPGEPADILEFGQVEKEAVEKLSDPIFATLAAPKLPELTRENRARLQMQSPTRLYFYWSVKNNPFQVLRKIFGSSAENYQLVVKLNNRTRGGENILPIEAEGNWWFNVDAASAYQAEIGFFATNRPFVRVMFSNTVKTPRKNPSPRQASEADWAVTATQFAEVLDISGFARDAFEVALAGDDEEKSARATTRAFDSLTGAGDASALGFDAAEVRFALLALASGIALADLRGQISEALFAALQANIENFSAEKSLAALEEHFDISADEITDEEEFGAAVYGASLVHFPKTIRKRFAPRTLSPKSAQKFLRKFSPVSS